MLSPYYSGSEQRSPPFLSSPSHQEPPTQTQMTEIMTQQTQNDENSLLLSPMISGIDSARLPPVVQPLGRLLPVSGGAPPILLMPDGIYSIGRSPKCDLCISSFKNNDEKDGSDNIISVNRKKRRDWAHGLISNRHCTVRCCSTSNKDDNDDNHHHHHDTVFVVVVLLEDCSGNGTFIHSTHAPSKVLHKGETYPLQSGDEICLLNPSIVQRKIRGAELDDILQRHSYVFISHNTNHHHHRHHSIQQPIRPAVDEHSNHHCFKSVRVRDMAMSLVPPPPTTTTTTQENRLFPVNAARDTMIAADTQRGPMLPPPGTISGDYILSDVLGTGTVGEVRRGIHRRTGQAVAVKIMSRSQLVGQAEAKLLEKLSHPYIIRLIHVYYEEHTVYLVMELMERDLFDYIVNNENQGQRCSEDSCRYIMRRLLAALQYLHEHAQIVHRDLKPENILVQGNTTFKLTDFGLAKEDSHGRLRTFCGTPQYFAPEVLSRAHTILGVGRYGKPADLYSLGVILHVMLTGCTPQLLNENNTVAWDPVQDANLSDSVKSLVQNLLNPNPSARLTVQRACDHPWINIPDGDTHCHPLDDPLLPDFQRRSPPTGAATTVQSASEEPSATESIKIVETVIHPTMKSTVKSPVLNSSGTKDDASPSDALTLDQLAKRPNTPTLPTLNNTVKSSVSSNCKEERRPLSPCNTAIAKSKTTPTVQNISFDDASLRLLRHKSITPGTPFESKELADDEVVSNFSNQTDSIGTFGTTAAEEEEDAKALSKPRRISEMQSATKQTLAVPRKRRATALSKTNKKRKAKASAAITHHGNHGQKSLKSFFSPGK